jgi:Spy/CpxP family protein refolding chaperone
MAAMQTELGLSAEQATQLKTMWSQGRKQAIRRRADTAIARMELQEAVEAPTVDEKVVAAKEKALSDLQTAALKARTDQRLAIRRILTPEQQAKMKQMMRARFHGRGGRPGQAWGRQRQGRGPGMAPPTGPGGPGLDEEGPEAPPES